MGYKQLESKDIVVREDGRCRIGVRNLPPDSDRFVFQYDEDGNRENAWPLLIVDIDSDGAEDKRLLPEVVMKVHGELPHNLRCSREDFRPKNGRRDRITDSGLHNVEYVGDGAAEAGQKPYPEEPDRPEPDEGDGKQQGSPEDMSVETLEAAVAEMSSPQKLLEWLEIEKEGPNRKDAKIALTSRIDELTTDEDQPTPGGGAPKEAGKTEPSDLQKGSAKLTAKEAIAIIEKYDLEELKAASFYTEESRDRVRVTVRDAWEEKQREASS